MAILCEETRRFYTSHLPDIELENTTLTAACPFCLENGKKNTGKLIVYLNRDGFFNGYFRCTNRCVHGGFPLWFAKLAKIDPATVPGYDPDRIPYISGVKYPAANMNKELVQFTDKLTPDIAERFLAHGVTRTVLNSMNIGYNGRYLVYPYIHEDGNCYSAKCIFPDREEDRFWYGDEKFHDQNAPLYNVEEIDRCENGTIFLCQGEDNLLTIKQLGFPAVAVHNLEGFEHIDPAQFSHIKTIFIATVNSAESLAAARQLASRIGFKVRLLPWAPDTPKDYSLWQMAKDQGKNFQQAMVKLISASRAFSPFASPERENILFHQRMHQEGGEQYRSMHTGFQKLDEHLEGIHGINVIGGAPKVGKSAFMIQIATEMSLRSIPVLYYDFENGRQKIYQRTLSRLSKLRVSQLRRGHFTEEEKGRFAESSNELKRMLYYFRVVNDRKVTPEIMRRHIDFIRHETRKDFPVVVIDSLHKLPFKDFSERRTGIDAWLRQMESIRDDLQVSFLVISELSRGGGDSYMDEPHMGMFKGSGDIEYSADNAMIFRPSGQLVEDPDKRVNQLWLVASREKGPGRIADYKVSYPYWGFAEM